MVDLKVVTLDGKDFALSETAVEEFKARLRGQLLQPGDEGHDDARAIFNAMIDRRPALIARCAGVADVIDCVNFARANNLLVSVRGGGHNVAGNCVCDGGVMIDLSGMNSVLVDPAKQTARAEAGATWGDFDHEAHAFGLATTGGFFASTGVAGLTLGGGVGWLMGKYGLSLDNLLSVDMVTADGRFVTASADENSDLFWGVRGGGGNFGVVTSFEFRVHPLDMVVGGLVVHPIDRAKEVLRFFREFTTSSPDEVRCMAFLATSPEGVPGAIIAACYAGSPDEGEEVMRPLKEFGPPVEDHIGPMPYPALQGMLEPVAPHGFQNFWKSNFMRELDDGAIDVMVERFATIPNPTSALVLEQTGGVVGRIGQEETAFSQRDARYNFLVFQIWPEAADNETNIRWVRETWDAMQPYSSGGVYVNYLGQEVEEGADRLRAAYGPNYERLVALKNKYDPTNFFRMNQNIRPSE